MAFDDLPKIDRPSINSDSSAIQLQALLRRAAGFVLRVDVPDLGCDFDVELIKNDNQASNWRFPVQLKSIENLALVRNGEFISYPFKTSRLGYLLRRHPAFGLVVLYDVQTGKLFYDYADEIYNRLMDDRGASDWKANEKVNILIPIDNELTADNATSIHAKFISRFEQGALMQESQGAKYGLPTINLEPKVGFDFNNLDDVKEALKKWGMYLLMQFDLQIVYELVSKLPASQITSDKDICLITLIAYAEVGKHADSVFYTERIRKRFELSEEDKRSVDFIELKNQLRLGDLSPKEYILRTKDLLPKVSQTNSLMLKINILYFELSMMKVLEPMPIHLGEDTQQLFFEIEEAKIDDLQKQYLKLWNAENLDRWISHFRSEGFAEMQIRGNMGKPLSSQERKEKADSIVKVHSMFYLFLNGIDKFAKETNDLLLQAHVIKLIVRFELSFEIDQISNNSQSEEDSGAKILNRLKLAGQAFNIFQNNNLYHDAYQILLLQIDMYYVGLSRYGFIDEFDIDELLNIKAGMEKELEYDGELSIPNLLQRMADRKGEKNCSMTFLKGLSEAQLDTLAEIMMQSNKFPLANKGYIVGQMKSHQLFEERCTNESIMLEEVLVPDHIAYFEPVKFILKNRITNMVSLPNINMDKLLKSWGY